ncbi:MAG TPA: squalene/phytoene synthase family protein, partial [Candidatus Eisenbacteria bacterium]|nr:squalene/phytoene synthase family protein [Candidatus Eisenbacteria bacterium]
MADTATTVTAPDARARRSNFGVAFALLPAPQRDAIRSVHAWSRSVDDGVDEAASADEARHAVALWRREVDRLYSGRPEEPTTLALRP